SGAWLGPLDQSALLLSCLDFRASSRTNAHFRPPWPREDGTSLPWQIRPPGSTLKRQVRSALAEPWDELKRPAGLLQPSRVASTSRPGPRSTARLSPT